MIGKSPYSSWVREKATAIFRRVAEAEGKVHGMRPEDVHFHEVGALDSIIDIIGACLCLEMLGRPRVFCGPVIEGHGWVDCAHGRFPVPTAATLEILSARGIPLEQCEEPHELVTPTGAAIIAELAESFGPMKGLSGNRIGYGLGTRDNHTRPNVLRAIIGHISTSPASSEDQAAAGHPLWENDQVTLLETNLDDCHPEWIGNFYQVALDAGALDVTVTTALMKKNRPGLTLQVLVPPAKTDELAELIFRHTTAIGMRVSTGNRFILRRKEEEISTPYGPLKVKSSWLGAERLHCAPEYDSAKALAEERGVSVRDVYQWVPPRDRSK